MYMYMYVCMYMYIVLTEVRADQLDGEDRSWRWAGGWREGRKAEGPLSSPGPCTLSSPGPCTLSSPGPCTLSSPGPCTRKAVGPLSSGGSGGCPGDAC